MDKASSRVAPEVGAVAEPNDRRADYKREERRQSRLQFAAYDLDDDGGGDSLAREEETHEAHFKRGETETVRKVLTEIETIALRRISEGFNEVNFSLGVLNCFLISFVVGRFPQHLWLLYLIESVYTIPRKFHKMWHAKPLNQALYYLDFCWCMNFLALLLLAALILSHVVGFDVAQGTRETCFKAALGVACGTLMGANIALHFVACLFHDVNSMTSVFIHLMPPLVMYTFMWHTDEIMENWSNVFSFTGYIDGIHYFSDASSVAGCATALYLMWWIFYTSFMLLVGINLPKKFGPSGQEANPKWDTVFHSTMRQGVCITIGKLIRGRKRADSLRQMEENDFDMVDFFIYMVGHMAASIGAICTVGYGCFLSEYFHLSILGVCIVLAVVRGAKRYTYYSTIMYSKKLSEQFADITADDNGKAVYSRMT